ncbi:tetratricopeptide repeat protein [Streptomyces sp. NPDC003660]
MGRLRRRGCSPIPFQDGRVNRQTAPEPPRGRLRTCLRLRATGLGEDAVPLCRRALDTGLPDDRRRQAVIQLASTLHTLGQPEGASDLLLTERAHTSDHLDDAVTALFALTVIDLGREREAAAVALGALASHLPAYRISVARHADAVTDLA